MKLLFSLLAILMLNKECNQNSTIETSNAVADSQNAPKMIEDNTIISYEASTRGFYEKIWVAMDSITITSDRNHMSSMKYPTRENDWNDLITLLKEVDIEAMPDLEAPTALRHHDGAAFATLAVNDGETEIKSNSFDNGYPPKPIEAVVNKVLSMKKMYQKN